MQLARTMPVITISVVSYVVNHDRILSITVNCHLILNEHVLRLAIIALRLRNSFARRCERKSL